MKNRGSFLFSIVLLLVNTVGAAGALLTVLKIAGTVLLPAPFLCGMLLLCLLSVSFWNTRNKKKMAVQWLLLLTICGILLLLFWQGLLTGLGWALRGLFECLNDRYGIHLIWSPSRETELFEQGTQSVMAQAVWSVLAVMVPYVMLLGYGVVRQSVIALLLGNVFWFTAACTMDQFPAYIWLVLCILGFAAVVIRRAFRDDEAAGLQAVVIGTAALGVIMALGYHFAIPVLDSQYESILEARIQVNVKINEEWIPKIKSFFARFGFGSGTDVTGNLARDMAAAYTDEKVYRVTFDTAPKSTVYLRGFAGKDYKGNEWEADKDSGLEKYYHRKGWELPDSGGDLVNLTYEAFRNGASGNVQVEELAAPGGYSVYPYGACLTEDYKVHWDGTVEWEAASYEFPYSAPEDYGRGQGLMGVNAEREARYREYVYDTFCEYHAEQFPKLTEFLEEADFRTGNVFQSLTDLLAYLKSNASYNLDVPNTPKGEDFIEYFLFESHEGYCAHFASAAVMILRYLGIPARYAAGYAVPPGDFERNGDGAYSAVVLDRQAHAWAEIYLDGIGWVPVEMTPGAVAFSGDNTQQQLELVGQLSGAAQDTPPKAGLPETEQDTPPKAGLPETEQDMPSKIEVPESGESRQESSGQEESEEPGDTGAGAGEEKAPQAGIQKAPPLPGLNREGVGQEPGEGWMLPPQVKAVLRHFCVAAALALSLFMAWKLIRWYSFRRLLRARSREKVFLLYRNTKRLLQVSGCAGWLDSRSDDAVELNRLLEKGGFGEKEPTEQELQEVQKICRNLACEVYSGLPFYKKPLFAGLNLYGSIGRRES